MTLGRKGYESLRSRHTVLKNYPNMLAKPNYQTPPCLARR